MELGNSGQEQVRGKFIATIGIGARDAFEQALKNGCHMLGVKLELSQDKGLLDTSYRIELVGQRRHVDAIMRDAKKFIENMNAQESK